MEDNYSRSVSMQCATCGGTEFEFEKDGGPIQCNGCERVYDRDELIRENGARVSDHVDDMKADIIKDVQKDLSKMFKKFK